MYHRYPWISRTVIIDLFHKYQNCLELVENDILTMFPIDEPQAFTPYNHSISTNHPAMPSHRAPVPPPKQSRLVAEVLRQRAVEEIERDAIPFQQSPIISMDSLRNQVWHARTSLNSLKLLANQTRNPTHIQNAKLQQQQLKTLSQTLLSRIRQSKHFHEGLIDLHGLTKEEALQLVVSKLQHPSKKRFRLITGKGIHSQNGHAVLKPALEKFFTTHHISYTHFEDGIISVVPPAKSQLYHQH